MRYNYPKGDFESISSFPPLMRKLPPASGGGGRVLEAGCRTLSGLDRSSSSCLRPAEGTLLLLLLLLPVAGCCSRFFLGAAAIIGRGREPWTFLQVEPGQTHQPPKKVVDTRVVVAKPLLFILFSAPLPKIVDLKIQAQDAGGQCREVFQEDTVQGNGPDSGCHLSFS